MGLSGGEPWAIGEIPTGSANLRWSPDGSLLAFTAPAGPPRFSVSRTKVRGEVTARRITRLDWRMDGLGHRDLRHHLFVTGVRPRARACQLTHGDFDVQDSVWAPDGHSLAFASDRGQSSDRFPRTTIWRVAANGGKPREVLALAGAATSPAFSPTGQFLAVIGIDEPNALDDALPGLFVAPADGSAEPAPVAVDFDRPIGVQATTDLCGGMSRPAPGPEWPAPDNIIALVTSAGCVVPWRFPVDAASGRPTGAPSRVVTANMACWSMVARRETISVIGTLGTRAPELMSVTNPRPSNPKWQTHTRIGSSWQRRLPAIDVRELWAPGPGGPIQTWVVSPAGSGDRVLPTVIDIHGGPVSAWSPTPPLEAFFLADRGLRVVLPNIRGSASYGRHWTAAPMGLWGELDGADIDAVVDHCVRIGIAAEGRLGVMGLSYGGFLTHWLVSTSQRFRAAVSENGVSNQVSAYANCDIGPVYNRRGRLGDVLTQAGVDGLWKQSPLANVRQIRTPLLMLQGEADLRCPPQDNEQLFVALKMLDREVEYVLYPNESHTFHATGRPDRRIDRMVRVSEWFERHLGVE